MRIISSHAPTFYVALLEDQVKDGHSPWVAVPRSSTHWSFAVKTKQTMQEGDKVEIQVSNDETEPKDTLDGSVVAVLEAGLEATYFRASYAWVRAVKLAGSNPVPVTVYGSFILPIAP